MSDTKKPLRRGCRAPVAAAWIGVLAVLGLLLPISGPGQAFAANKGTSKSASPKVTKNVAVFGTQTSSPDKPDGRGFFDFGATPGGDIEDHVAVINYSAFPVTLVVGASDAVNTPQGGFALLPANRPSKDIGTWVAFRRSDLSLNMAARSTVIIPFLVEVPRDASPGDHIGGITATLQSFITGKSGQRIRLLQSVGTRLFVRVSGPLHPNLAIQHLAVKYDDPFDPSSSGTATISYTLSNVGNVALGGQPTAWVSGLLGTRSTAKLPEIQLLLPGNSVRETVKVKAVCPELRETAHLSIKRLVIPGSVQPASGPFKGSISFWAIPWLIMVVIIVLLGGALWWFVRWRRKGPAVGARFQKRRKGRAERRPPAPRTSVGSKSGEPSVEPRTPEPAIVDGEMPSMEKVEK